MAIFRDPKKDSGDRVNNSDRSAGDRLSHRKKVKKAIADNIMDIIAEESIIGKNKNRIIKVPIRGVKEYRFVYGDNAPGVGQGGDGEVKPGQIVGKGEKGSKGDQSGDQAGVDYYETEVDLDELLEMAFDNMDLPDMTRKALRQIEVDKKQKKLGWRKKGPRNKLNYKKTQREHVKSMQAAVRSIEFAKQEIDRLRTAGNDAGADTLEANLKQWQKDLDELRSRVDFHGSSKEGRGNWTPIKNDDMRYTRTVDKPKPESNAVVLCIMDTSGSMDTMKKYIARMFFFLLYKFLMTKYRNVEVVFIAHHTEAREVTEEEFFTKGESGGTFISSGYNEALRVIFERFHPSLWNVYAFHCSDGDNFESDNPAAMKAAKELCEVANLFGYGEIKPLGSGYYGSSMIEFFNKIKAPNFQTVKLQQKEDIWPSLKAFLDKDRAKEVSNV